VKHGEVVIFLTTRTRRDQGGGTALILASQRGHLEVAPLLRWNFGGCCVYLLGELCVAGCEDK
jgi:hypothetical protein